MLKVKGCTIFFSLIYNCFHAKSIKLLKLKVVVNTFVLVPFCNRKKISSHNGWQNSGFYIPNIRLDSSNELMVLFSHFNCIISSLQPNILSRCRKMAKRDTNTKLIFEQKKKIPYQCIHFTYTFSFQISLYIFSHFHFTASGCCFSCVYYINTRTTILIRWHFYLHKLEKEICFHIYNFDLLLFNQ